MLTVIVKIKTMTGRSMCSVISYCDNNRGVYLHVFAVMVTIMTITWMSIFSVNSYYDNNGKVYMQC